MSAIKYSPYIPNTDAWVKYFKNQPQEYKKFYTIGRPKQKGEDMDPIKLVTPTEQAVEQARSAIKRQIDIEDLFENLKRARSSSTSKKKKQQKKFVISKSSDRKSRSSKK